MNILNRFRLAVLFVASLGVASAQCVLTPTTLAASVTSGGTTTIVVTSATPNSTTTCPNANFAAGNSLYVDRELMSIRAVSSTTITVIRGQGGTFAVPHTSGALVFVGQPSFFAAQYKQGRCTRTNEVVLPVIDVKGGGIYDCLASQWTGSMGGTTTSAPYRVVSPTVGATAYTGINTNGTAPGAATTMYCTEIDLPAAKLLTGLAVLNGTTVGTDKHIMILYDAGGNALAYSATAGTTTSGASTYQQHAFTATYFAVPGRYFGCMQTNGTTDTVRMALTGISDNQLAGSITGQTFGTVASITAPTSFTTAVGPFQYVY